MQTIFPGHLFPDLIVGLDVPDDAAVWRLDEERSLVITIDFFPPVVDNPYDFGAIAAANALSDIYAMGGIPILALNIAAFPPQLPGEILTEILQGAAEQVLKAGAAIVGGHTIKDDEPKYGLVVVGTVATNKLMTKGGFQPGDALVLTKPIGSGILTTALKNETLSPEHLDEVVNWMSRLNRSISNLATTFGVSGATDITGFGLIGHAMEVAEASGVQLRFSYERIPFFSGAAYHAMHGAIPGGSADNQLIYQSRVEMDPGIDHAGRTLLNDAQTSGGLLLSIPQDTLQDFLRSAREQDCPVWVIGDVQPGAGVVVTRDQEALG